MARLSKSTDQEKEQQFLAKFDELYPEAVENWLTKEEKAVISGSSNEGKDQPDKSASDPIKRLN